MKSARKAVIVSMFALVLLFAVGCQSLNRTVLRNESEALTATIAGLGPTVDRNEARKLAELASESGRELRSEYRIVGTPGFHNLLVNWRLRKRGLCYHWADDLASRLRTLDSKTLVLKEAVAYQGSYREHNCVVVTERGGNFRTGVFLDGWRRSGHLVWGIVKSDRYPWVEISVPVESSYSVRLR